MKDLLTDVEAAAGLTVYGASLVPGAIDTRAALVDAGVPGMLLAKDPTLWGGVAEAEAAIRLGWVDTFRRSRELLPRLAELRAEYTTLLGGPPHVVLAGMGGSSLAPEVIARTLGLAGARPATRTMGFSASTSVSKAALTILDTTDPGQIRAALADRLDRTVVVVSSKSGSTVETDSHRRAYLAAFGAAGLTPDQAGPRFVVVTDPGSPLAAIAEEMGAQLFLADPDVGGRYSALTAFGIVPTALAGADVAALLDEAEALHAQLGDAKGNPGLALGVALGAATANHGRNKLALAEDGSGIVGLGDWAEQLIAESTGKSGTGILPVVVESPTASGMSGAPADVIAATVGAALPVGAVPGGGEAPDLAVNGPLGAQFLAWEYATAIAGRILGINPFDQPNVAESKENTNHILAGGLPPESASFVEGSIEVYGARAESLSRALADLVTGIDPTGYLAVMAYLDRVADADAHRVRAALAANTQRPVTFGWGPRFLHSTGQFHKGGPATGSFLQITGAIAEDLAIPGEPYTFGVLQAAQAAGDRRALAGRGRPLLRLHLTDRAAGVRQLLAAVAAI